jgi:L-aminopeptidase/D-esterase-like protein
MKGGIGTASERSFGGLIAGALAAVNASGEIVEPRTGRMIAGALQDDGTIAETTEALRAGHFWRPEVPVEDTVLVVVATNVALNKEQANRLATVCHDGIARAVRPAHTQGDGDIVFTLATGQYPLADYDYRIIEALATRAVERAIVRGVTQATSLGGVPAAGDLPRSKQ